MTAFEIISVVLGILGMLIAFLGLVLTFLLYLDKRYKQK